ncbi:hypothetical protein [Chryseobacterium sp. SIMBA_029]|uniref:hypothetical protein n=1 Tax=Chryseobacterium sp. SIMBA_029 TaxID=3085772 RepID=UPI0039795B27
MVRIINYKKRQAENREFFVLEVSGGIEMVLSKTTGMYYATSKKATITSTFNEETCKSLVGSEFPGSIVKEECEPYEYTIQDTGEFITLSHRYVYRAEELTNSKVNSVQSNFAMTD